MMRVRTYRCRALVRGTLAGAACLLFAGPGSAQGMETVLVEVGARNPSPSPDGATIAVSILGDLFTIPAAGGTATPITRGETWDRHPAWSPDGRFLAYSEHANGTSKLVVRNLETGLSRVLHEAPNATILQVDYDPSGDWIYFLRQTSQYDAHLWRISTAGTDPEQLTFTRNWHEWSFALSPDGDEVLLETGRYEGTDLYLLRSGDPSATRVTDTEEREQSVAWSADGARRAWVATRNGVDRILVSADGGPAREIHRFPYGQTELAFEPGGDLIVSSARRLYRLDPRSGDAAEIPVSAPFLRAADPADDLVITGVRLFDGVADTVVENATVVITDGRIARVTTGPVDAAGHRAIDGAGRTLLPALMDNHQHFWDPAQGPELLAHGVTMIRDPGVAIADGMDYKDASALGILAAPRIFSAGPLLDGPGGYHPMVDVSLDDPAAAAPLVRALKEQGVDALKAYFLLEPDVLAAVVAEAKVQGLPVTGHIGVRTSWGEAMDAGIAGFNHVRVWKDFLSPDVQPDGRDESLDSGRDRIARMQADWTDIDPESPEVSALLRRMAETGTALDPTLVVQRIPESDRASLDFETYAKARESFERMKVFVRRAVAAGVPLLAGTDNVSLNDELETYADAGIPNAAILEAATVNGARWLGVDDEYGTVEVGKRANLLLVEGDPLADVRALRDVVLVVKDGVVVFRRGR